MLYHAGVSQHTQNIQINKVIGKNEKKSLILWKKLNSLFGQPNIFYNSLLKAMPSFDLNRRGKILNCEIQIYLICSLY